VRRIGLALVAVAVVAVAVYWFALRGSSTTPAEAQPATPVAQIGEGRSVIVVGSDGRLLGKITKTSGKPKDAKKGSEAAQGEEGADGSEGAETTDPAAAEGISRYPVLPLKQRPKGDRVQGHVLEQVHILAAAPKSLRHLVARTRYGKTGVEVEFTSGIEVRFGDDVGAERKWKAAAAILADPSVTVLSYVDVHAPTRPTKGGDAHELPPAS
jgi:hypothetical protein